MRPRLLSTPAAALLIFLLGAGSAVAGPKGNDNWTQFTGTCNGQEVSFLDPPGNGPTAWTVGGSVGVGKIFRWTDAATGEVLHEDVYGKGLDPDRMTHCSFFIPDVPLPGGTVDIQWDVWALTTPQGH